MKLFVLTPTSNLKAGNRLLFKLALILSLTVFGGLLLPFNASSTPQKHSGEVPTATIDCKQDPDDKSKYLCAVVAQCPDGCPQYKWSVPDAKIVGDATKPNITIDVQKVDAANLLVTCRVRWKQPSEEVTLRRKLDLR